MAAAGKKKAILAVDIKQATTVGSPLGGSTDAVEGDVVIVGTEISEEDAGFLCAAGIGVPCAPTLQAQRVKEKAGARK